MTRLVIKTFLDRPKWGTASAFSGAGLPDGDEAGDLPQDESMLDMGAIKKKPKNQPAPMKGDEHIGGDLPEDESMLDFGKVNKAKPAAAAHGHDDHGHAHDLPQDESMLDMGRVSGASGAHGHDAHAAHDAQDAAHDSGHGHDDAGGHGSGHGHGHHGEPHESPPSMLVALVVLAAGSVLVGFLGVPAALGGSNIFEHWLAPVTEAHAPHAKTEGHGTHGKPEHSPAAPEEHGHNPMEYLLMAVSVAAALGGIGAAWYVYKVRNGVPAKDFVDKHQELYELVRDKYRVDELYRATIINPLLDLNEGTCRFDNEVVDAAVNGAAVATQAVAGKVRRAQTGNIKDYLTFALVGGLFVIALFCLYLTRVDLAARLRELLGN
jgi:NADH:ubiquinone oxidoreductase subunit 5 (subunit L)/multisubunit Na+/H+ antiporter MnhA subunit